MRKFSEYLSVYAALVVLLTDQLTKKILVDTGVFWSKGPFSITVHYNEGIAFSLPFNQTLLIGLSIVILATFIHYWTKQNYPSKWQHVGAGLFLGGALSNLLDRIVSGAVTDYLNLYTATINIADIAIVLGIFFLIFSTDHPFAKQ